MRNRGAALAALALAAAGMACGGSETKVVDQYFNAVKAKDNQTLSSFAAVTFDKPVESWKITKESEETKAPVAAPELAAKVKDLDAQLLKNSKDARATLDGAAVDQIKSLRKAGKPIPPKLQADAASYDKFTHTDAETRKALSVAKEALDREKRNMMLSVGQVDNVESVTGEMITKQVELDLTLKDETPAPYLMTLRKYVLQREGRNQSRWVIQDLKPRS